jgi:hypothetical protein
MAGAAIPALWCGIASTIMPFVGTIVAVVLGIIALLGIHRSNGKLKGRWQAGLGITFGLLSSVAWVAIVTNDRFQDAAMVALAGPDPSTFLAVGDCLDVPIDQVDNFVVFPEEVVPCNEPHSFQYIGFALLPYGPDAAHPGDDAALTEGGDLCLPLFEEFTGSDYWERFDLELIITTPHERLWEASGAREVNCYVGTVDLSLLTESVEGSG